MRSCLIPAVFARRVRALCLMGAAMLALLAGVPSAAQQPDTAGASAPAAAKARPPGTPDRRLSLANRPWQGDFDAMLERRVIRVLVPYSRTLYYNDMGRERGLTAELMRDFERYINKRYADRLGKRPVTLFLIPTTRERMLPDLVAGLGDIAAGNLTVTDERLKVADFIAPKDRKPVRELVVTGPGAPDLASLDDLSGKTVHVRRASSYFESLSALDREFRKAGKAPMRLILLPDALEDEDMLEMTNAGLLKIVVVDDWKAAMWAQILPDVTVHDDLAVRSQGVVGWAIRKDSPQLLQAADDFYLNYAKKQGVIDYRIKQAMKRVKQIRNNTEDDDLKRFEQTLAVFRKYGAQYGFDPLMLAAQGYQESQLDQGKRSHVGAVGIMQIMPRTGNELGVGSIAVAESNIHAGVKYMDQLMTRYFADAKFDADNRTLFAFASYNAGPGNIAKMRKEASVRGLDPDRWFNNVEIVVAEKIGMETTTYVRNIYKYYAAYRLLTDAEAARGRAMEKARQ